MKSWELFAALIALIAGLWSQIQMLIHWARGFAVATKWCDESTANTIIAYLAKDGLRRTTREPAYKLTHLFLKPVGATAWIAYEKMLASGGVLWIRKRPLWIAKQKDGKDEDGYDIKHTFSFIRGTLDFEKLLIDAAAWRSTAQDNSSIAFRYRVVYHHGKTLGAEIARDRAAQEGRPSKTVSVWSETAAERLLFWKPADVGRPGKQNAFGSLALTSDLVALVDEIKFWRKAKKLYKGRAIPWRRGYLFYGLPGTGKTSIVRAAAEELDLPVHVFDLATMSNEDLREAWGKMSDDVPCVALIEDVDGVFHGRENIAPQGGMMSSGGLTFNELLNTIDGVERTDGVLLVVTTNHKEYIDPALNRPGRIDREVEFGPLNLEGRMKVAKLILADRPLAEKTAMESGDIPAAVFTELCCRMALKELYSAPAEGPYR